MYGMVDRGIEMHVYVNRLRLVWEVEDSENVWKEARKVRVAVFVELVNLRLFGSRGVECVGQCGRCRRHKYVRVTDAVA